MLKRYLAKHNPGLDLEDLKFNAVDKETKADETTVAKDVVPRDNVNKGASDGQDDLVALLLC